MLYMVVETFRGGDPVPVYRRFRDQGRLMPEGIEYRGSWVTDDLLRCSRSWNVKTAGCSTNGSRTGAISPNSRSFPSSRQRRLQRESLHRCDPLRSHNEPTLTPTTAMIRR